jgi:hypothetical protein
MKDPINPFNDNTLAEEIISVTEQIDNVLDFKNKSPEDKAYEMISK